MPAIESQGSGEPMQALQIRPADDSDSDDVQVVEVESKPERELLVPAERDGQPLVVFKVTHQARVLLLVDSCCGDRPLPISNGP